MPINPKTCYLPVCDDCGHDFDGGEGPPHFDSDEEAKRLLPEFDAIVGYEVVFCGNCRWDHECMRCNRTFAEELTEVEDEWLCAACRGD